MLLRLFPHRLLASFALLLTGFCSAQDATVSMRFLAFPAKAEPEPVELVVGEGKTIKVDTPGNELSQPYKVANPAVIAVGQTGVGSDGKPAFNTYGKATGISAKEQIVLLLRKGEANSDGFVVLPLSADLDSFGGAHFLFINASNLEVGGRIGDKTIQLKPGQRTMLKPTPDFTDDICQVSLAYMRDNKWKMFFDTRWPANDQSRAIVFFYQNPQTGRLGIAPITDIVARQKEENAANP
ncbi:MAG: hypothetical protein ACKO2G_15495 [Verrucomicrobiales bacterium]